MIHIVFSNEDAQVLKSAIALDEKLSGEVIYLKDDYAVGPLQNMHSVQGAEQRSLWWQEIEDGITGDDALTDSNTLDLKTVATLVGTLRRNDDEQLWIWAAQNAHDVSGYFWLLHFLMEFQGRVFILYLNNLPFINEKGSIFYPQWLYQIPVREFLKAKKLARPITAAEFEVDGSEWQKLAEVNLPVRILEGGKKLGQHQVDFYDDDLLKLVTTDWQKASKLVQHFSGKSKHTINASFILWRFKTLASVGSIDTQGRANNAKEFEIKTK